MIAKQLPYFYDSIQLLYPVWKVKIYQVPTRAFKIYGDTLQNLVLWFEQNLQTIDSNVKRIQEILILR